MLIEGAAVFIGIAAGVVTGLIPGIHVNLITLMLLSVSPFLLEYMSPLSIACSIISMATTHSFLDFIPSTYLGAPDADTALNVLPAHRLLLEGRGFEAVKLTVIGSLGALILSVALIPIMIKATDFIYPYLKEYIGHILVVLMAFMILRDKKRVYNFLIFGTAGVLGLIVLNMATLKDPLFPMLSGLFGTSLLLVSLLDKTTIPVQKITEEIIIPRLVTIKALISASFAGALTAFFPGLGAAQGAVIAQQLTKNLGNYGFMILVGGINTVNFVLSLVTLFVLDKARNGAVIAVSELMVDVSLQQLIIFSSAALIAGGVSVFLAMRISRLFSQIMTKVNYRVLVLSVIGFVAVLVFVFSGFLGIVVLIVSTAVGILSAQLGVAKNHQMACLILPVILFFLL